MGTRDRCLERIRRGDGAATCRHGCEPVARRAPGGSSRAGRYRVRQAWRGLGARSQTGRHLHLECQRIRRLGQGHRRPRGHTHQQRRRSARSGANRGRQRRRLGGDVPVERAGHPAGDACCAAVDEAAPRRHHSEHRLDRRSRGLRRRLGLLREQGGGAQHHQVAAAGVKRHRPARRHHRPRHGRDRVFRGATEGRPGEGRCGLRRGRAVERGGCCRGNRMGRQPAAARLHRRNPDDVHRPGRPVQGAPHPYRLTKEAVRGRARLTVSLRSRTSRPLYISTALRASSGEAISTKP